MTLAEAIAHVEGFYNADPMTRARRCHNPGNLNFAKWEAAYGAVLETIPHGYSSTPRFAAFPDDASGWAALHDLLTGGPHSGSSYPHLTVEECFLRFAPPSENDTAAYISRVCAQIGCKPGDLVKEVYS